MSDTISTDADWGRLREAFDRLIELPEDEWNAALSSSGLVPEQQAELRRLLVADGRSESFLVPHQAILLPAEEPSSALSTQDQEPLPRHLGRYELRSRLGSGGMGVVFLAHDALLDRPVALKVLSPHLLEDPQWLPRFRLEARTAGSLNHPNIITVHDIGVIGDTHFLTAEFIDGETLRQRLSRGPLPLSKALDIACQIASALAAAHAAGIVHRDLKPENVMLRPDGLVKVLDFGLAKHALGRPHSASELNSTRVGQLLGTLHYMSPEQARGLPVGAASDVFSFGVVLYEMLMGVRPFCGNTALDVLVALLEREPAPLSSGVGDAPPPPLQQILLRALQKDPASRYQTAHELLLELHQVALEPQLRSAAEPPATGLEAVPEVHYAHSGDVSIAYQVLGEGPLDLVFVMGWISHLEYFWREPSFARFLRRLAQFSRVILFDKRGTGLSDRVAIDRLPTLEQRVDDVRAVLDEVGSQRAILCGISEGGPMCALFAATHPERTQALVMIGSYARRLRSDDYPWGSTPESRERFCAEIQKHWGGPVGIAERAPSRAEDPAFRDWWAAYLRHGASPSAAVALTRMNAEIDIRSVLPTIRVPTLVVHRTGDRCLLIQEGRYLASRIPGAHLVELPGDDHLPFVGDQDAVLSAIERFVENLPASAAIDRVLATVLVARVAASPDDEALTRYRLDVLRETTIPLCRSLSTTDTQLTAAFSGPARAVRAACELAAVAGKAGVAVKIGVHTGACELQAHGVIGEGVTTAIAVAERAEAGEIWVTSAVSDLVAGAGIRFEARGRGEMIAGGPLSFFVVLQ